MLLTWILASTTFFVFVFVFNFLPFRLNGALRNGWETHMRFAGVMRSLFLNWTLIFDLCVVRWGSMRISSTRLGLELMSFGRVPTSQAMTPSWGNRVPLLWVGVHKLAPQGVPPIFYFLNLDRELLRPSLMPLHSWRPLVHNSHIECTSSWRPIIQYVCSLPLRK